MTTMTTDKRPSRETPILATFTPGEYVEALDSELRERMVREATERRLSEEAEEREADHNAVLAYLLGTACEAPETVLANGVWVAVPGTGCECDS